MSLDAVIASIRPKLAGIQDAIVIPLNPPPIPGLGMQGGFELWIQDLTGGEPQRLAQAVQQLVNGAKQQPVLAGVNSTFNPASRQLSVKVDREKAETLGAPIADVYGSLQSLFGSLYVSQYNKLRPRLAGGAAGRARVPQHAPRTCATSSCAARSGEMVPLDAVTTARFTMGPDLIPRFNGFPAAKINGGAGTGLQLRPGDRRDGGARRAACPKATASRGPDRRTRKSSRQRVGTGVRVRPRSWCS